MREEEFEQDLKSTLSIEKEVPFHLTQMWWMKSKRENSKGYVNILLFLSVFLMIFEEILLFKLFFINVVIFTVLTVIMISIMTAIAFIIYLFKEEINNFIL